ncbi:hypothetical protein HY213_00355 [Candidatus Peregrinibacteria bacterium]|nr:hypothetical protein [Candidatus Peregrinibacteria bacterium]
MKRTCRFLLIGGLVAASLLAVNGEIRVARRLPSASAASAIVPRTVIPTMQSVSSISTHPAPEPSGVSPYPRVPAILPPLLEPDIHDEDRLMANEVLRLLPSSCRRKLQTFIVRYDGKLPSRGYAGASSIILDGRHPMQERRAVLMHEGLGHFFSLGCLAQTIASGNSEFQNNGDPIYKDNPVLAFYRIDWKNATSKRAGSKASNFVTGYAKTNCFEDIAETATYYVLRGDDFRRRATKNKALAAKLAWIEKEEFPSPPKVAQSAQTWDGNIPWDATLLGYTWKGDDVRVTER